MSKKSSGGPSAWAITSTITSFLFRWLGNFFVNAWDFLAWVFRNRGVATQRAVQASNNFDLWCISTFGAPIDPWIKYLSLGIVFFFVFFYTQAGYYIATGLCIFIGAKALRDTLRPHGH